MQGSIDAGDEKPFLLALIHFSWASYILGLHNDKPPAKVSAYLEGHPQTQTEDTFWFMPERCLLSFQKKGRMPKIPKTEGCT